VNIFYLVEEQLVDPPSWAITKGVVLIVVGIIAGSFTNAPSATETTHSRLVVNHNSLSCNFHSSHC
jgi:hypothetical protein